MDKRILSLALSSIGLTTVCLYDGGTRATTGDRDVTPEEYAQAAFIAAKWAARDAVDAAADALIAAGAPAGDGLHLSLDDASRADMGGMATTAVAAASGSVPWPESYSRGWITVENIRLPLATPAEGLQLAAAAGDFYARTRQHARDLKDAIEAAADEAALAAIDTAAGWPE